MKGTVQQKSRHVSLGGIVGRLFAVVFALFLVLAAYFVARGFGLYQDALAAKSLDEMAASIESRARASRPSTSCRACICSRWWPWRTTASSPIPASTPSPRAGHS